jgi:hypothetical protein
MYKERSAEELLMDAIILYREENYNRGNEKVAERDARLLSHANSIIAKFELYLKTIEKLKRSL